MIENVDSNIILIIILKNNQKILFVINVALVRLKTTLNLFKIINS